ncbi:TetR/AcrR family transcriptional regulator [Nocardia australiensis]|uniref:TetR/AcrR family transcriptional regulator n=1 Tax=Nocardia australiensis TaxID=2887191 RepID=UPI001D14D082|nr:TetR/AcrR family transcriptional regulator [Nocardia australiensis]
MARTGRPRTFDIDEAIDAALGLFWSQGYEATSLAQLREATGLSSASFYAAFSSKYGIFEQVVDRYVRDYGKVMAGFIDDSRSPREALESTLRASLAMQTDPSHTSGCLVALCGTLDPPGEEFPRGVVASRRAVDRERIIACVRRGVENGELAPETDAVSTASALHAFLLGLSTQIRDGVSVDALEGSIDQILAVWDSHALNTSAGGRNEGSS